MSSNKRTSKVKNGILVAVVIAFLIAIIGGTYARYSSSGRVDSAGEIAKWNIKLGNQDISSETKTIDVTLAPDTESNENVKSGKLAPGQKLSGTFKVDPTGSEVAVDYLLSIGSVQVSGGTWNEGSEVSLSKVTALLEDETDATELTIAEGGTTYFENLTDVLNGKDVTFKVYVTWENNEDANNDTDTKNGVSVTQITIPVTVVVRQHIGDVTPQASTSYTVTFKDGETTLSTQTVNEGETATKPTDPTKDGFEFVNWYSDSEFTTEYDFASIINGDTTIYAKWTETASGKIATGTYTAGQEVVYNSTTSSFELMTSSNSSNTEHFFVVEDKGSTVKLLSKYCLNREGTAQTTKDATDTGSGDAGYGRVFSRTNYWKGKDGVTTTFDLQTTTALGWIPSEDTAENNAILAAQAYGESKGVKGTLMTYAEADGIQDGTDSNMKNILWGKWTDGTQPTQGYLFWWLGAAFGKPYVWYVNGYYSDLNSDYYDSAIYGVRPVLVVPEE